MEYTNHVCAILRIFRDLDSSQKTPRLRLPKLGRARPLAMRAPGYSTEDHHYEENPHEIGMLEVALPSIRSPDSLPASGKILEALTWVPHVYDQLTSSAALFAIKAALLSLLLALPAWIVSSAPLFYRYNATWAVISTFVSIVAGLHGVLISNSGTNDHRQILW